MSNNQEIEKILKENFSDEFIQKMRDRVVVSNFKYGPSKENFSRLENPVNAVATAKDRIKKYEETGNLEFLIDAANYLMFRFMYPWKGDFFAATSSEESPGNILENGKRTRGSR